MGWGWLLSQPPWRLGARRRSQVVTLFKGSPWKGAEGGQELGVLANGLGVALVPAPLEARSQETFPSRPPFQGFTLEKNRRRPGARRLVPGWHRSTWEGRGGGQELGDEMDSIPFCNVQPGMGRREDGRY